MYANLYASFPQPSDYYAFNEEEENPGFTPSSPQALDHARFENAEYPHYHTRSPSTLRGDSPSLQVSDPEDLALSPQFINNFPADFGQEAGAEAGSSSAAGKRRSFEEFSDDNGVKLSNLGQKLLGGKLARVVASSDGCEMKGENYAAEMYENLQREGVVRQRNDGNAMRGGF